MSVATCQRLQRRGRRTRRPIQRFRRQADVGYVILEDSSRWPFRRRARAWLETAAGGAAQARPRIFELGGERVLLLDSAHLAAAQTVEGFLLVRGEFSCGPGCRFLRPVYVGGDCEIGKDSRLEAIAADGALNLCPGVEVRGGADSLGSMEIRGGCRIGSLASSATSIRLGLETQAAALFAPAVTTWPGMNFVPDTPPVSAGEVVRIPPPGRQRRVALPVAGPMEKAELYALGADTWVCETGLHFTTPVVLEAHVVTGGAFCCPAGSLLDGDVKAAGSISVGAGSVARGNLLAGGDLILGPGAVFQREVRSRQRIRFCAGVRGLRREGPVEVWAAGELVLEDGVTIRGSLSSGCRVVAGRAAVPAGGGAAAAGAGR